MLAEAVQLICDEDLRRLKAEAALSPRLRSHLLLHSGHEDQVQRLLIAGQPGTYVRPHQHSLQWEMLFLHSGSLDVLIFDENGALARRYRLDRAAPVIQIPIAAWHGCVVHEPDTVVLETKPGPYRPNEFAAWSPAEGESDAPAFIAWTAQAPVGQGWRRG
jgi:cupin fold WbuC family metalloprotein